MAKIEVGKLYRIIYNGGVVFITNKKKIKDSMGEFVIFTYYYLEHPDDLLIRDGMTEDSFYGFEPIEDWV